MEALAESLTAPLDRMGWMIVGGLLVGGVDVRLVDLKMFEKLGIYLDVFVYSKIC